MSTLNALNNLLELRSRQLWRVENFTDMIKLTVFFGMKYLKLVMPGYFIQKWEVILPLVYLLIHIVQTSQVCLSSEYIKSDLWEILWLIRIFQVPSTVYNLFIVYSS